MQNKVVLVSRQGNSESLDFQMIREEIAKSHPDYKCVSLCKKIGEGILGKVSYCGHLIKQMWHIGTSEIIIADSYCIGISLLKQRKRARIFQIWHALGALKKFGKSIAGNSGEGRNEDIASAMNMHGNYTKVLVSSENCRHAFGEAFGYGSEKLFIGSLPRVDAIRSKWFMEKAACEIKAEYPQIDSRQVIVYAPTFRKGIDISKNIVDLTNAIDHNKYILIIKKHPLMTIDAQISDGIIDNKFSTLEMLSVADIVICDYSAVIYEAALAKKKLVFYAFDIDTYGQRRDFYIDYFNEMPGPVCKTADEVADVLMSEEFQPERVSEFADKYVEITENCTEKLVREFYEK
ncbi:MAG: CDP-glycerol glycerophosphotransferase family protein [Anaerovoracaceae bacterium]|nr:CDP-glycerol glycerophosphotransferase family protein [Anaerovoracaceae bacterium]